MRSIILAALALSAPLAAQQLRPYVGGQLQAAFPVGDLGSDLRHHLGSGVGVSLGVTGLPPRSELRMALEYTGTHVAFVTNTSTSVSRFDSDLRDIWRTLRIGGDHLIRLQPDEDAGLYAFYGGGVRNLWVNRTRGSLLEVTLLAIGWAASSGGQGSVPYAVKATALDIWRPYVNAGMGWRSEGGLFVEATYVAGRYQRFRDTGLRTIADNPVEERLGHQIVLCLGARGGF